MKLHLFMATALIILSHSFAFAVEDCSAVDVRESLPADVKAFMTTPSNQGDIGWCFGWAATDLLSQAVGTPVSALHTSSYYSSQVNFLGKFGRLFISDQKIPEGGDIVSALKDMNSLGYVCREKDLPSQGLRKAWYSTTGYMLSGINRLISRMQSYRAHSCEDVICKGTLDSLLESFIPGVHPEAVKKYLLANPKVTLESTLFYFLNSSCRYNSISLKDQKINYGTAYKTVLNHNKYPDSSPIIIAINQALEANRLVGLEYDASNVTSAGGIFGAGHASTIVARKKIANQCYYLVRNSWGTSCDYLPGIICEKEQGSYWVTSKVMEKMASKITWIK